MELKFDDSETDDSLMHYGILRRSGRYPWGSGKDQNTRNRMYLDYLSDMRKSGMSEADIARSVGLTTTQLRALKTVARAEVKAADIAMAQRLRDKGYSNVAIGQRMNLNESSVRALLAPGEKDKSDVIISTSNMLKDQVGRKQYIDIGSGVDAQIGVSRNRLDAAVEVLKEQGYTVHSVKVQQLGTGEQTTVKVLAAPGKTQKDIWSNRDKISQIQDFSEDGGRSFLGLHEPLSVSSKRVAINYAETGGTDSDGVVFVRPGVKDLSLGGASYAQVRIAVDGTHYIKGMAIYKDDLPKGVDLMFNTNKSDTGNKLDALKPLKTETPDNPFGAMIKRQMVAIGPDGKPKVTSAMNIVNEEGDWENWSRNLPSQMLGKQDPRLAKRQLDITYERRKADYDEISSLTNPVVRKKLLEKFAEDADSASAHLKAAALPGQATHVLMPVPKMKPTEIYAPNYENGTRVALVRFPHGGTFEIPDLVVNNRHPDAKKMLGKARDAVGISSKVAERLSGADFDGDTVLVIPNNKGSVKSSPALKGLKGFDPKHAYPGYPGMKALDDRGTQMQMGLVSNLITDMTIRGASSDEVARAVRHSMVVIDAQKHKLNYKQSAIDNGIPQLMAKYQRNSRGGASTLLSQATGDVRINERRERRASEGGAVDPKTGKKVYVETGVTRVDKAGKTVLKTQKVKRIELTDDAHTLSSGTEIESIYATHSNRLKALGNAARKQALETPRIEVSKSAKQTYANEIASLDAALNRAYKNRPRERQAQILANATVASVRRANPDMDKDHLKRLKRQALEEARARTGAGKSRIVISDREWQAIQSGAISSSKLESILANADMERVRQLATPKTKKLLTDSKLSRAKVLLEAGYTQAEVARSIGVSVSTLKDSLYE